MSVQFTFGCRRGHHADSGAGSHRVRMRVLSTAGIAEIIGERLVQVPMESVVCVRGCCCCCCGKISHTRSVPFAVSCRQLRCVRLHRAANDDNTHSHSRTPSSTATKQRQHTYIFVYRPPEVTCVCVCWSAQMAVVHHNMYITI